MKNNMLMHIQDKNLSGKVFGGLILRAGYELGWLCASRFLKTAFPVLTHVDDVQFLAPV
jgi:acyl-coenzyme A thioesterase 9